MTTENKRAPRTPRTYESIEKGALGLGLQEQRDLVTSIDNKLKELDKAAQDAIERAKEAKLIANGK